MSYATPEALGRNYPEDLLAQLTDPDGAAVQEHVLVDALQQASDEIDAYLQGRYSLPLQAVPAHLATLACDIAVYRLMSLRRMGDIEDQVKRYTAATRFLERVSSGAVQLGLSTDGREAEPQSLPQLAEGRGRLFDRESLQGF